jgi:hypothetical protein
MVSMVLCLYCGVLVEGGGIVECGLACSCWEDGTGRNTQAKRNKNRLKSGSCIYLGNFGTSSCYKREFDSQMRGTQEPTSC